MTTETAVIRKMVMTTELCHPVWNGMAELTAEGEVLDLKPERVQEWLQAFPAWRQGPTGKTLHRAKSFLTPENAAQYGAFVTGLAAALALPVRVSIANGEVELALYSDCQRGRFAPLTEAVLEFAAQIG